ncbi:hypothetical protein OG218_02175 [Kineococcus sp. NBC_00420]|uniref:hypothetical protein n=1 Tax=Kineococcus sp. NBC_00420 TaxID=2903564 RepID=UPI002E1EADB0
MSSYTIKVRRETDPTSGVTSFVATAYKGRRKLGTTDARHLRKLDQYVRDVIVLGDDLDDAAAANLDLVWRFEEDDVLDEAARTAAALAELRARESRLVAAQHATIRTLVARGMSVRDVAAASGVSPGRVGQVASVSSRAR